MHIYWSRNVSEFTNMQSTPGNRLLTVKGTEVHTHLITPEVHPDPVPLDGPRSAEARLQAQAHLRYNLTRRLQ